MVRQVLPGGVAERADEALRALFRHPERTLLPWYRYALYAALEEDQAGTHQRARAWLDIFAARKVLFCWQSLASGPRHSVRAPPSTLLSLAVDTIRGDAARSTALAELDHALAYRDVAGELPASPHYAAWCVYEAAARALESACAVVDPACGAIPSLDDAAGYVAIAVAGRVPQTQGAPDQEAEDARLRRAVFWEWWLREALPNAVSQAGR